MELVSFAKDVIQNVAEQAASYRIGQSALRHIDRALWVVEKCARWAVPPPLDADERPQPELVRPLPWVFFLTMLVTLRITRESISLINLVLGKPPLRSADVVMYIQSKRRYLRTLKYQGSRNIRARRAPAGEPWYSGLRALLAFTMCFRRSHYGNNNTTRVSNNDEVLVIKRSKRTRETAGAGPAASETSMERLIEKMMVEVDADSDDDSSYTLTNATSLRSLRSEESEFDQDNTLENITTPDTTNSSQETVNVNDAKNISPLSIKTEIASSTPEKSPEMKNGESPNDTNENELDEGHSQTENGNHKENVLAGKMTLSEPNVDQKSSAENNTSKTESPEKRQIKYSPKETTNSFLQSERCSPQKQSPKQKFANGRAMSVPNKKKGLTNQRRISASPVGRFESADDSF